MRKHIKIVLCLLVILIYIDACSAKRNIVFYDFPLEKKDIDKVLLANDLDWSAKEDEPIKVGEKFYYIQNENKKYLYGLSSIKNGERKTLNIIARRTKIGGYEANLHADASMEEELKILNSSIELFSSSMDGEKLYKSASDYYKEKGDQVDVAYEIKKDENSYSLIFLKDEGTDTYFLKSINISGLEITRGG